MKREYNDLSTTYECDNCGAPCYSPALDQEKENFSNCCACDFAQREYACMNCKTRIQETTTMKLELNKEEKTMLYWSVIAKIDAMVENKSSTKAIDK